MQPVGTERKHWASLGPPAASPERIVPLRFEGKCSFRAWMDHSQGQAPAMLTQLQRPSIMTKWNEVSTRGVMQEHVLYPTAAQQEPLFRTSHPALMRVNGSGFALCSTCWYFSLRTWCPFPLHYCTVKQKLLITEDRDLYKLSPPYYSCPLLYLSPPPPAGRAKTT